MTARDQVRQRVRRLYGIADADAAAARYGGDPVTLGDAWLGRLPPAAAALQGLGGRRRAARRPRAGPRAHAVGATFLVNDGAELAAAAGADGVHLGQGDGPIAAARRVLGEGAIVGRSSGTPALAAEAAREADIRRVRPDPGHRQPVTAEARGGPRGWRPPGRRSRATCRWWRSAASART
ncbi:MAG: thiamine phosphate synthase [Myxococcota bacterium]